MRLGAAEHSRLPHLSSAEAVHGLTRPAGDPRVRPTRGGGGGRPRRLMPPGFPRVVHGRSRRRSRRGLPSQKDSRGHRLPELPTARHICAGTGTRRSTASPHLRRDWHQAQHGPRHICAGTAQGLRTFHLLETSVTLSKIDPRRPLAGGNAPVSASVDARVSASVDARVSAVSGVDTGAGAGVRLASSDSRRGSMAWGSVRMPALAAASAVPALGP
jgi:hypothetical protein